MELTFKLTSETKLSITGETLYRIEAIRDIPTKNIVKGTKGGFISTALDRYGDARVSGNAWVYGDAQVYGDARVSGNAWVYGDAQVCGNARVYGDARVYGYARVYGEARVYGNARVSGNAWVYGDAQVCGNAWVYGDARVYGYTRVSGDARVSGNAWVYGDAQVSGNAWVYGDVHINSISSIIVLCIAMKYSVTITKNLIFIGCQMFETKKALKISQKQAIELGLPKEYYKPYMEMIKGAIKLIK